MKLLLSRFYIFPKIKILKNIMDLNCEYNILTHVLMRRYVHFAVGQFTAIN